MPGAYLVVTASSILDSSVDPQSWVKLDANLAGDFEGSHFPKVIVHELWVGNIMTPVSTGDDFVGEFVPRCAGGECLPLKLPCFFEANVKCRLIFPSHGAYGI